MHASPSPITQVPAVSRFSRSRPVAILGTVALVATFVLLLAAAGPDNARVLATTWLTAWILAPALLVIALGMTVPPRAQSPLYCAIIGIPVVFGPVVYVTEQLGRPDAQGALVYVAAPLYQLLALPVAIFIGFFVVRRRMRAADAAADARDAEIEARESQP
jgi:hypothetical protein